MNHGYSNPAPGSSNQTLTITMKPPTACSPIPHLLEIDPFEEFEFSFPSEDMWWDNEETSDYFSDDASDYSATPAMLNISFQSEFYCLSPDNNPDPTPIKEEDVLIQKITSTLSHVAPTSVYKRRKSAKKRRKHRRKRKLKLADNIEPELRAIWHNFVDVLPVKDQVLPPPPVSTLPTINLAMVNKQMLRRLPDVVYLPVLSCSPDPAFYERNLPCRVLDNHFVSAFGRDSPFGKLPAIYTDLGPVPPPTESCYGYVWTEEGGWRVKAERPPVPDPGGGRERVRGRREKDEHGDRGWKQKEVRGREK